MRAACPKDKLEFNFFSPVKISSLKPSAWIPVREGTVFLNLIRVPVYKDKLTERESSPTKLLPTPRMFGE